MAEEAKTKRGYNIEVDWDTFDKLCQIQCTKAEIASVLGCSEDTIERRVKEEYEVTFAVHYTNRAAGGRAALRRKQFEVAMKGSVPMLIWLGKNTLSQSDKNEIQHSARPISINYINGGALDEKGKLEDDTERDSGSST